MATRGSDIIARLALNAEAFSAAHGEAFSRFEQAAKKAGSTAKADLSSAFNEVSTSLRRALDLPSLDGKLNLDTGALRASAEAASREAVALREIATAAEKAALSQDRASDEAIALAQASAVSANAAEQHADKLRRQAIALDGVQAELGQTAVATRNFTAAGSLATVSAASQRAGMQQLSFQLGDMATMWGMGAKPMQIFASQSSQVVGALSLMTNSSKGLIGFLGGPWGQVLTSAAIVTGALAGSIFDASKKSEEAAKAAEEHKKALDALVEAMDKSVQSAEDKARADAIMLEAERLAAIRVREKTQALLQQAKAELELQKVRASAPGQRGEIAALGVEPSSARIAGLEAQLAANQVEIEKLARAAGIARGNYQGVIGDALSTPEGRVNREYERQRNAIIKSGQDDAATARALEKIRVARDAEIKAIRESEKALSNAGKTRRDGDTATPRQVSEVLLRAFGGSITSTTGGRHTAGSDHYKSQAIDFVPKGGVNSITKDQVRAVFEAAGLSIRRNAGGTEQLFGPGDKGHNDHWHVAWQGGKGQMDSDKINERIAREQERAKEEQERAQKEINVLTAELVQRFDEASAAGRTFVDTIEKISRAQAAGALSDTDAAAFRSAAKGDLDKRLAQIRENQLSELRADLSGSAAIKDPMDAIGEDFEKARRDSDRIRQNLYEGADIVSGIFGSGLTRVLYRGAMANEGGASSRLLLGAQQGYEEAFDKLARDLDTTLNRVFGDKFTGNLGEMLGSAMVSASVGSVGGSLASTVFGTKKNGTASALGGVLGGIAGKEFGKVIGEGASGLLKTISGAAGPLGSIIGGVAGNLLSGAFSKTKNATTSFSVSNGTVQQSAVTGNTSAYDKSLGSLGTSFISGLEDVAEQLGGKITGAISTSIGMRKGEIRVDTSGTGKTKGNTVLDFYDDAEGAIKYAIQDAINDGVITGISAASLKILKSGQDLEKAITKATMIESIPKDLKRRLDPVGAAIDEVNSKWEKIIAALEEGGASAEQFADAQRLYNLEMVDAKATTGGASEALKTFLSGLRVGSSSPLSLTDQQAEARRVLDPYLGQINRGEAIDQDKYQAAAQTFLDIERQLYGSTSKFFDAFNMIQDATGNAIATIDNATPITTASDLFNERTAASSAATAANTGNVVTLLQQISAQLASSEGQSGSYIGTARNYV